MTPTTTRRRITLTATAGIAALLAAGSAHAVAAPASAEPDPAAVVDAFVAWGATSDTELANAACALPAPDRPQVAVCYGTADGSVVLAAVVLGPDGAPGTIRAIPTGLLTGGGLVAADSAPTVSGDAAASFGSGTYEVGTDVVAGVYATRVPDGETCYWERVSGFDGETSDVIATGSANAGQLEIVLIDAGDAGFTSNGCGTWRLLA